MPVVIEYCPLVLVYPNPPAPPPILLAVTFASVRTANGSERDGEVIRLKT